MQGLMNVPKLKVFWKITSLTPRNERTKACFDNSELLNCLDFTI